MVLLVGCTGYTLQGRVLSGPVTAVRVVDADDPRLEDPGLAGAVIDLTLDPGSLARISVPPSIAGSDGSFAIPIDQFGAGLLEYDVSIVVRCEGHESAAQVLRLPLAQKRMLVWLAAGPDTRSQRPGLLEETLELGKPYLRGQ